MSVETTSGATVVKTLRLTVLAGLAALLLSGCSDAQLASTFGNWCKHADNCTDNSRPRP
ncbi:hypothetical protein FBZ83_112167 [Azospirillum brasilense]|uniref:Uncharacterized protein n=1 Tax=Azospirillum brasilense TaxID=192 RepID=A0A560C1C5_AZOBR|nr:hypothetical protein FBZ83_112167 [Azospirillum brasilense]